MDRRSFIRLTAVSGTTAALASCGNPDHQLIRFVPAEDIIPGQAVWKPSVCPLCPSGCGLTVRVMDAEADVVRAGKAGIVQIVAAKKLEGTPDHPVNRGGLCARGQAAIQVTYHPDRITQPLKRKGNRGDGQYDAISWDDALAEVVAKLDELAVAGNQRALAFLARPGRSHRAELISQFLAKFGAPSPVVHELFSDDVLRRANALSFGREQLPTYDLANTRYLLSFGADFLGTWNAPVSHSRAYGEMRQGRPGVRGSFVQFEARMSQTGASADEWVPVKPGTEGVLALGIANVIIGANLRPAGGAGRAGSLLGGWTAGLTDYTPEQVAAVTSVPAPRIERLAREFAERTPSVAVVGGPPLAHTNGLFNALAVNALNALVGSVDQPGGVYFMRQIRFADEGSRPPADAPYRLQPEGGAGPSIADAQVLFVDGANPVFTAPRSWKVRDAFAKVPYIVSFGHFLDETSSLADLILPDHTFLESWTDALPESGSMGSVASVAAPVMMPLYDTRATPDVLLDIAQRLAMPIDLSAQSFEEVLTAAFMKLPAMTEGGDAWTDAQEKGFWTGEVPESVRLKPDTTTVPNVASGFSRTDAQFAGDAGQYPFHFLPYPSNQFLDGSTAHLPWLQEMPDPLTSAMWSSWVEINPATAQKLGIAQGDIVEIASEQATLRTAAYLSPGIAPDVLAMPMGQGHTTFTRYASGRGENPADLLMPMTVENVGAVAWAATRVKITRVGEEDGRLILFAGGMREHVGHGR
jgi:menaquinone reductase, molybdopterin-binding-like subunit